MPLAGRASAAGSWSAAPTIMQHVYDAMSSGETYEAAVGAAA